MRNPMLVNKEASGKLKAFLLHIFISGIVAACTATLVFIWYPGVYMKIAGGSNVLLLVIIVDTVLGPVLTLFVYHKNKSKKEIIFDFSVIAALQITALTYGIWTSYAARPVYLVFEYQRMAIVSAIDLSAQDLRLAPLELQTLPKSGPKLLSLRNFNGVEEQYNSVMRAMAGQAQAAQTNLWQPYEAARVQILETAKPLGTIPSATISTARLAELLTEAGLDKEQLRYIPVLARKGDWIFLIDAKSAEPKGMMALEPS